MARSNSQRRNVGSRSSRAGGREDWSVGVMDIARERPVAAATVAISAAAAGLFLWSKRSQISSQLSSLSDQIGKWTESAGNAIGDDTAGFAMSGSTNSRSNGGRVRSTGRRMRETGAGATSVGTTNKTSPGSRDPTSPSDIAQD